MNNTQRTLLAIYLPLTVFIIILDNLYASANVVQYTKYVTIITLFLAATYIRKHATEQKLMSLALLFVVIADFFLVFSTTIANLTVNLAPFGVLGFTGAYLCLITVYHKNFKIGLGEIVSALLIGCIFIMACLSMQSHIKGPMLTGAMVFGLVLCCMTWTSICTIFWRYYRIQVAGFIAVSGVLMFISDIGVAYASFHPFYSSMVSPCIKNIVWATYIPAWTLVTLVISDENPCSVNTWRY